MDAAAVTSIPGETPLATAEFLCLDTETNGLSGDACELTEVGAVLVGGGELHERWETLVGVRAPLSRGIQRFTGITQAMVDEAPPAEATLPELASLMQGRVLVAHSASFDRRVLRQAFERAGIDWVAPPVLCTVALARRLHPLARQRKLAALAGSLGIEVEVSHRALADAETCARVFCALFPKLCANAATVGDAVALLRPARPKRPRAGRTDGGPSLRGYRRRKIDTAHVPDAPGVYVFRNASGQALYVGKSVSLRSRVRAHFAPSSPDHAWISQAETVHVEETASELGALLLEHRRIRELDPPGNVRSKHVDRFVYLRCRMDIAFPVLEVAAEPASGRGVSVGPLLGRHLAVELLEQLNSLFGLRHCGRALKHRPHASAYGQMGRCLSPCLGDLDPNAYRRRLDEALALFAEPGEAGEGVLRHLDEQMRAAAAAEHFERAAWLRRRRDRLVVLLQRLGGVVASTHARPRMVVAPSPCGTRADVAWVVGGRVVDWGEPASPADLVARTRSAAGLIRRGDGSACATPDEARELRIVTTWAASQLAPVLPLDPEPPAAAVAGFLARATGDGSGGERELDDARAGVARDDLVPRLDLAAQDRQRDGAQAG